METLENIRFMMNGTFMHKLMYDVIDVPSSDLTRVLIEFRKKSLRPQSLLNFMNKFKKILGGLGTNS